GHRRHQRYAAEVGGFLRGADKDIGVAGGDLKSVRIEEARLDLFVAPLQSREQVLEGCSPFQVARVGEVGVVELRLRRRQRGALASRERQRHRGKFERIVARLGQQLLMLPRQAVEQRLESEPQLELRV